MHGSRGGLQAHAPSTQRLSGPHATPQPPQWLESDATSTQRPSHTSRPAGHEQAPCEQTAPSGQTLPHAPQCAGSPARFAQAEPQRDIMPGQPCMHPAPEHIWPGEHAWPHPPQLVELDCMSTHTPPQLVVPAGHAQVPSTQTLPPVQRTPHPPQCESLESASTHAPAQSSNPAGHAVTHAPAWQDCSGEQREAHEPQCAGSTAVETHVPSHIARPGAQRHSPPRQVEACGQRRPHCPQLAASEPRSTHARSQSVSCGAHVLEHAAREQTWEGAQVTPQPPQCEGSVDGSTHAPAHASLPDGHRHTPSTHACAGEHARAHAPQWSGSENRSTQAP
jgi:hypothetical protein